MDVPGTVAAVSEDERDMKAAAARRSAGRNRLAKWMWLILLTPPNVAAYFLLDFELFVKVTSLETVILSIIALTLGNHAAQKGAEAEAAGFENP
jgi:hypothetical protein